jgi:N-terminal domain of galactosyltransferase
MNPHVCIPFRPADPERVANLACTVRQWEALGWPVHLGDSGHDSFHRGASINVAAGEASDAGADVLVICDCDFLLDSTSQAVEAAETALRDGAYVVAFSSMRVLGQQGTNAIRDGRRWQRTDIIENVALIWGNCFAVPTELFWRVCGFDDRFLGWGAEDIAFLVAASTMGGPKSRVMGGAFHLTHPTNEDRDHLGENNALASHYRSADGDREAMKLVLAERGCE